MAITSRDYPKPLEVRPIKEPKDNTATKPKRGKEK